MTNRLKIVLDTNILLVSISSKSKYHWIFSNLLEGRYELYITNEILLEYEEIISQRFNKEVSQNIIRTLLLLDNVSLVSPFFKWDLINDKDDNKFVDCYLVSNSDLLVTNDRHFNILKDIDFPKINIIDIDKFREITI